MSAIYVNQLKECCDDTRPKNEPTGLSALNHAPTRVQNRFPSVESVISDIDAKWKKCGLVA